MLNKLWNFIDAKIMITLMLVFMWTNATVASNVTHQVLLGTIMIIAIIFTKQGQEDKTP